MPLDGTYVVMVVGYSSTAAAPYSFRATAPPSNTSPLTLGETVNGNIAAPGQQNSYTFTGSAGQRLYFDSLKRQRPTCTPGSPAPAAIRCSLLGARATSARLSCRKTASIR